MAYDVRQKRFVFSSHFGQLRVYALEKEGELPINDFAPNSQIFRDIEPDLEKSLRYIDSPSSILHTERQSAGGFWPREWSHVSKISSFELPNLI